MPLSGTLINIATVLAGTIVGSQFRGRPPERFREMVVHALGLVTLVVGMEAALAAFGPPLSVVTRAERGDRLRTRCSWEGFSERSWASKDA